ncbi:MAG TPA: tetraacyldisaccharide 4'-kinase [Acidobacteriaceae bacterium]
MSARRPWAWPLVPLYAAGLAVKDGLRAAGVLKTRRLKWPVVSVGSLSAGGAGKTPVVIALAELLSARGWNVDVLSRGHGRNGSGVECVQPDAESAAERYGDEPVLIARRTGVPVWVGARRFDAGVRAEAVGIGTQGLHLLDDGFQHGQLARAVDVVLVTEPDLDDALLPAGNLRKPLRELRRAHVLVVREEERERVLPRLREFLPASVAIWTVRRTLGLAVNESLVSDAGIGNQDKHLAFCAIARPEDFLRDLRTANVDVVETMTFSDHHRYTIEDMDKLVAACDRSGACGFVATEKDAVKLSAAMQERLESRGPLAVARLDARLIDEDGVMRDLEAGLK